MQQVEVALDELGSENRLAGTRRHVLGELLERALARAAVGIGQAVEVALRTQFAHRWLREVLACRASAAPAQSLCQPNALRAT